MNKYLEVAKKLKALAEKGVGGERYSAQQALDRLMRQHSFLKEDLENETRSYCDFFIKPKYKKLMIHIALSVIGNEAKTYMSYVHSKSKIQFKVTPAEHIEIQAKYDFYVALYEDELLIFEYAFLLKHDLFNKDKRGTSIYDLSPNEKAKAIRALMMSENMKTGQYKKQLPK